MAKGEDQSSALFKDSPSPADDHHQHSDGEDGSKGLCWFGPSTGRGRWRFARLNEGTKQSKWRVSPLTRSETTNVGRGESCCCSPRWRRNSKCADGDGNGAAAAGPARGLSTKGNLLRKFASFNDSSSPPIFADGSTGRVNPALSSLPVRPMSKVERDKGREAFVPLWQRRASMSPIKALDLRHRS